MSQPPPIEARQLSRAFGDDQAVDAIDLAVVAGEVHAIVGLNGAGKTTLMRLLLGMLRADRGDARIFGHQARSAPAGAWRRTGHMIDAPFAYPELSLRENLMAAALLHGLDDGLAASRVETTVHEFELGRWRDRRVTGLSMGNRQRLGLGSALIHQPEAIVLDEPANSLDPSGVVFIRDLLRRLADNGAAVLVSSHHLDQLARIADRITVLHRGRLVGSLPPGGSDLEGRFFEIVYEADIENGPNR